MSPTDKMSAQGVIYPRHVHLSSIMPMDGAQLTARRRFVASKLMFFFEY